MLARIKVSWSYEIFNRYGMTVCLSVYRAVALLCRLCGHWSLIASQTFSALCCGAHTGQGRAAATAVLYIISVIP